MSRLNVALVGLGFGSCFLPIYVDHPDVATVGVYDPDMALARTLAERHGADRVYDSFEAVLADPAVDAVHLVSPIPCHGEQTLRVLESGKHCACTVPMATDPEDLRKICEAVRKTGKKYMMMETTLYTYQYLYVRSLLEKGDLGRIQFLRGSHYQDMAAWPDYWMGLPPMWYGTHAIAPLTGLADSRVEKVCCFGSGNMAPELVSRYGNPFPVETAVLCFANGMKAETTRSLFETARVYQEGLFVYGSRASFEWGFGDGDAPVLTRLYPPKEGERGGRTETEVLELPNPCGDLPEEIRKYTIDPKNFDPLNPQKSLEKGAGGGHHGSHPHLVHEFVRSVIEDREPAVNAARGANITAAGLYAHMSAMKGGEMLTVPEF